jgi:hypothetical protein
VVIVVGTSGSGQVALQFLIMNAQLQQTLVDRYPRLLDLESGWWGPGMGFTYRVGAAGWFDLLDRLFQQIATLRTGCVITRVKEKMGELRIYCDDADDQVLALIDQARMESARTCQVCGGPGTFRILPGHVAATICETDAERLSQPFVPLRGVRKS